MIAGRETVAAGSAVAAVSGASTVTTPSAALGRNSSEASVSAGASVRGCLGRDPGRGVRSAVSGSAISSASTVSCDAIGRGSSVTSVTSGTTVDTDRLRGPTVPRVASRATVGSWCRHTSGARATGTATGGSTDSTSPGVSTVSAVTTPGGGAGQEVAVATVTSGATVRRRTSGATVAVGAAHAGVAARSTVATLGAISAVPAVPADPAGSAHACQPGWAARAAVPRECRGRTSTGATVASGSRVASDPSAGSDAVESRATGAAVTSGSARATTTAVAAESGCTKATVSSGASVRSTRCRGNQCARRSCRPRKSGATASSVASIAGDTRGTGRSARSASAGCAAEAGQARHAAVASGAAGGDLARSRGAGSAVAAVATVAAHTAVAVQAGCSDARGDTGVATGSAVAAIASEATVSTGRRRGGGRATGSALATDTAGATGTAAASVAGDRSAATAVAAGSARGASTTGSSGQACGADRAHDAGGTGDTGSAVATIAHESGVATVATEVAVAAVAEKGSAVAAITRCGGARTGHRCVREADTEDRSGIGVVRCSVLHQCESGATGELCLCALFEYVDHLQRGVRLRHGLVVGHRRQPCGDVGRALNLSLAERQGGRGRGIGDAVLGCGVHAGQTDQRDGQHGQHRQTMCGCAHPADGQDSGDQREERHHHQFGRSTGGGQLANVDCEHGALPVKSCSGKPSASSGAPKKTRAVRSVVRVETCRRDHPRWASTNETISAPWVSCRKCPAGTSFHVACGIMVCHFRPHSVVKIMSLVPHTKCTGKVVPLTIPKCLSCSTALPATGS